MKILQSIDNYFFRKSKKEFYYFLLTMFLIFGLIFYSFLYYMLKKYYTLEKEYKNLQLIYKNQKILIDSKNSKIVSLINEINTTKNKLLTLEKDKIFYLKLSNQLSFADFDNIKIGDIIRKSVENARKVRMRIESVNNIKYAKKEHLSKKVDVMVKLKGDYKSFIYYLYNLENTKDLIRITEIKILPNFYVKFSVYGYVK